MRRKLLSLTALSALLFVAFYGNASAESKKEEAKRRSMEEALRNLPDSVFENVKVEDLLDDEVYLKLARDGWSSREITTIMETAVRDKKTARRRDSYGQYAKEWRPAFGRAMSDDPLYEVRDSSLTPQAVAGILSAVGENNYNSTWPKVDYDPNARKRHERNPGYFRALDLNPTSGRVLWMAVNNQKDKNGNWKDEHGDSLYVIADGAGIFRTADCGKNWVCITDNIPERAVRGVSSEFSIPVDPDDFKHLFAFMQSNSVFESLDAGDTWQRVPGATYNNKKFKRGYAFRAKKRDNEEQGELILIGAHMNNSNRLANELWLSYDKGVTWKQIKPTGLEETVVISESEKKGFWFQQMAFDYSNPDVVYFPGSYSILYFDDAGRSSTLKKLVFDVYGLDQNNQKFLRYKQVDKFPFKGNAAGHMEIDPNNPDRMWYAVGNSTNNSTALYYSDDHGRSWVALHEPEKTLEYKNFANDTYTRGSGTVFGNETANTWIGGFGVEFKPDGPADNIFGCSMSSAYSFDGGTNWTEYAWGNRQRSWIGNEYAPRNGEGYYYVSASRHNADNHGIVSHRSGRVFRLSDGGMFMHDPEISGVTNDADGNAIAQRDWINIGNHMGQMLFYNVRVNEFGDQAIIGNTQDIDVQTYRYGRWGHWRGYEGTESSFNPYTGTEYFSGSGGEGPDGMNVDSWNTARNYADVVTGSWYMLRTWGKPSTLFRVDDVGRSLTDLYGAINKTVTDVQLARDKGRLTVFIRTSGDNALWMSTDTCRTFQPLYANNGQTLAAFSNSHIAVDPDNSDIIYIGQNDGRVFKYNVADRTYAAHGTGLPTTVKCSRILFHEGSGDLYYVDFNSGIYILKNGENEWKFWVKGYNCPDFSDCDLNYTTQEMVIADFGRGVWVADLETPADRYFSKGFSIKEYSHRDDRRTFGIDTEWTIPMYYNYKWTVGGRVVENYNYQYLTLNDSEVPAGTEIKLELTLRESPDVKTVSDPYTVKSTQSQAINRHQGNALYSNGMGRVDIGYMDWFDNNFSVDLWVNPQGDGVILGNTQKSVERGAKGWVLYIENGTLKFKYYPTNVLQLPTYEASLAQSNVVNGAVLPMNKWSHVAVTQNRHGEIVLYINGERAGSAQRVRQNEDNSLNNSVIMSLFGDALEQNVLNGSVDELKVWNRALTQNDIRREMFSTGLATEGLMAHYDFNGEDLASNTETFTGYKPLSRTRAVTSPVRMTVPVTADYVADADLNGQTAFAGNGGTLPLVTIDGSKTPGVHTVVYGYNGGRWENADDNLSELYYNPTDYGYMIRTFGALDPEARTTVKFHNGKKNFDAGKNYRLYMADNSLDRMYWKLYDGTLTRNSDGTLSLSDVALADIVDRKLMIVTMKPAIEMTIDGLNSDGRVVLYDDGEDKTDFDFTLRLIENKKLNPNSYEIMSDSAVIELPQKALTFDNKGEYHGKMTVNTDLIGPFNNTISTFIHGRYDDQMIPIPVDILNRITPSTLDNCVQIEGGGMKVGTPGDFASLTGTKNLTIMGWVRIDNADMMKNGRNNDGVTPLLFFRTAPSNAGTTGIHLRKHETGGVFDGASLGYHWNDKDWNYSVTTPFIISKDDLGKWNHVALVVTPQGAWLYFNGMEYKMPRTPAEMPVCEVQSPLLIGMNIQGGNTYFKGAFDHVAVWDRSLSSDEIRKYMQNRVLLNDANLLAYMTMDEKDDNGRIKESLKGMTSVYYGNVSTGPATPVPFAPYRQNIDMTDAKCPITLSTATPGCVATFRGTPYNYLPTGTEYQEYLPLTHDYYTLVYKELPATSTANVTLTYKNESIVDADKIAVGIRKVGSVEPFADYYTATSVKAGEATFSVPATRLAESSEVMFFSTPESGHRPTIVHMNFSKSEVVNGGVYLLDDKDNTIDVDIDVVSGDTPVSIVKFEDYVTLSANQVNMNNPHQTVRLTVDANELRKQNPFGLSDVTLRLEGTVADPLTLQVGLKPVVKLKLVNGDDGGETFKATDAVSTLDVEAELVEGYLDGDVELKVTPEDLQTAFNINTGSLLLNKSVTVKGLSKGNSSEGDYAKGWNLIGNPYLTKINLTKSQNYGSIDGKVTHFVYQSLEGSDNIIAFDMTDYDDEQRINPFQAYYVQAMDDEADFTVTAVAKEKALDRKTFNYLTADEVRKVELSLYDSQNREIDRTVVRWDAMSHNRYGINEDAPKVTSANSGMTNSLYTMSEESKKLSINVLPLKSQMLIPMGLDIANPGEMTLKVTHLSGFNGEADKLWLVDFNNGQNNVELTPDKEYTFTVTGEGPLEGRFLIMPTLNNDKPTGVDDIEAGATDGADYRVYTDKRSLTVTGLRGDAQVNVYNAAGVLLVRIDTTDDSYTTDIDAGVYVVRIRENGKDYSTKAVVR